MRVLFGAAFLVLALLSVVAWRLQPEAVVSGKTVLTWVSDDNPVRKEQIGLFNRLHPNLSLRLDPNNTGLEKVIVQSVGGVGPDLFDCYDGYQLSAFVKSGIAWDVTEALKKAGVHVPTDVWKAVHPNVLLEGRVYGFPTNAAANAIWYNKALFQKAGVPFPKGPWKWDEFVSLAKRLTIRDARGRARQFGLVCDWWNWPLFVRQWGGRIYTEDGARCVVDSPEAIAGVQFLHDLIYVHKVMPSPVEEAAMATAGGWGSGTITQFGAGKAAMALGGRWWLCTLRGYANLSLGAVEAPHYRDRLFLGYGRATLINRNSPRRQEALQFLLYMARQEYNELINAQADGLSPVIRWCDTPRYQRNPDYPQEDYNAVWREIMDVAVPNEVSPFVNGQAAQRILNRQLDLVKNDQKPVAEALRTAAQEINAEIQRTIARDPSLRARYERLVPSAASP